MKTIVALSGVTGLVLAQAILVAATRQSVESAFEHGFFMIWGFGLGFILAVLAVRV